MSNGEEKAFSSRRSRGTAALAIFSMGRDHIPCLIYLLWVGRQPRRPHDQFQEELGYVKKCAYEFYEEQRNRGEGLTEGGKGDNAQPSSHSTAVVPEYELR